MRASEIEKLPQWLKEVVSRGFNPGKISHGLDDYIGIIYPESQNLFRISYPQMFVLEGLPGTGKTSILERFTRKKEVLRMEQILPYEPEDERKVGQNFFFRSDELKTELIRISKVRFCLMDRYYASTLAFCWAETKLDGSSKKYDQAIKWYKESIECGKLLKPFTVLRIRISPDLSFKRRDERKRIESNWSNKKFLRYFDQYLDYFYSEIEPHTNVIEIDGEEPLDRIVETVEFAIYGKQKGKL